MPTVRYEADGGRYRVDGHTFEPGDEVDVSEGLAEHLVEDVGDFEHVHENVTDVEYREVDDNEGEGDSEDAQYEERVARAEGLANEHWSTTVSAIEDGEADEYLDQLKKVDDRGSVQEAIDERQAELEG